MKTSFISSPGLRDRISTNSNKIGIVLFYGLAMTNEQDINYSGLHEINTQPQPTVTTSNANNFIEPQNEALSLFADKQPAEEQVILDFANRLLNNAEDIDPEISKIVQKRFWDMI